MALGAAFWYVVIPYPWTLRSRNPVRTSLMEQRIEEARRAGEALEIRQRWVPLEAVSPRMIRAVIVAEDHRFREHGGIDWTSLAEEVRWSGDDHFTWWSPADLGALARALGYVWTHRGELRGRSTITQQLAKNLYFGTDRSLARKAMEFVVARRLERRLGKDRILELYLNVAEWGPGVFGVEAAARTYFGVSAGGLSLWQAASLAATLPHPRTSNPARNAGRMAWRRDLILQRLNAGPGAVPAPIPLPDAAVDLPPEAFPLPEPVPGAPPPGRPGDTLRPDTLRPDTLPAADTLRPVPRARLPSPPPLSSPRVPAW
ncbi:MAG: biosynthetic peptidoglycan transglycosylase [Longimicrobiales bacterium]|nr:biosynthetic peptidoglycan transglycosylase [Longimicrobiales bacterium]